MATLNDFKLLNKVCLNYFDLAKNTQDFDQKAISNLQEIDKKRFGFYYLILNEFNSVDEFDTITKCICDQDFRSKIFKNRTSDEGVDAIYIDEDNREINIFNFKFREKFNADKIQSKDEAIISSKFLSVLKTENNDLDEPLKSLADQIIEKNNSNDEWETNFYIVSNENRELNPEDRILKDFADLFAVNIKCIGLNTITNFLLPHHKVVDAMIILPSEAVMSFSETSRSSDVSYIVRMRLTDLIRITCDNPEIRNICNLEDETILFNCKEEYDVLFDNVRGLILNSKFNKNIEDTLLEEPSKFFYYNNGITIVASNINYKEINSGKKIKLELYDFQVLNGGQTLRTVHKFNKNNDKYITDNLSKAQILVRILKVTDPVLKNKIGEFTNSQNAIKASDLKSLRKEQLELEKYLAQHNILYIRKRGERQQNTLNNRFSKSIGMERLGQILWSVKGSPELVSNKKKEIFTTKYDDLFNDPDLISNRTVLLINQYLEIKDVYKISEYMVTDQKCMYILYISHATKNENYHDIIKLFESCIETFKRDNNLQLSNSRILILGKFKDIVNSRFNIR